jgi:hypothetical protein
VDNKVRRAELKEVCAEIKRLEEELKETIQKSEEIKAKEQAETDRLVNTLRTSTARQRQLEDDLKGCESSSYKTDPAAMELHRKIVSDAKERSLQLSRDTNERKKVLEEVKKLKLANLDAKKQTELQKVRDFYAAELKKAETAVDQTNQLEKEKIVLESAVETLKVDADFLNSMKDSYVDSFGQEHSAKDSWMKGHKGRIFSLHRSLKECLQARMLTDAEVVRRDEAKKYTPTSGGADLYATKEEELKEKLEGLKQKKQSLEDPGRGKRKRNYQKKNQKRRSQRKAATQSNPRQSEEKKRSEEKNIFDDSD